MLNSRELEILTELETSEPLELYRERIAANNTRIRDPELDNGRDIAAERTAIHTGIIAHWAAKQHRDSNYAPPFAVVAHGGTGRGEMAPCSDTDIALLCDDDLEDNAFINSLQKQVGVTGNFTKKYGFKCGALPFNLEAVSRIDLRQMNSFLDMRPIYDPTGLTERFREALRSNYDPFEHFLHVHGFWKEHRKEGRHNSEGLDRFDIKMDGLRLFLAGIWARAGRGFRTSHEIYRELGDSPDLKAYHFLMRIRAFVHARRGTQKAALGGGAHNEDVLSFDDFTSFGEMLGEETNERAQFQFANKVRGQLLKARRRVARFTLGVMGHELAEGRRIGPNSSIFYGPAGLRQMNNDSDASTRDRSSAALSLLHAAQRYRLPIDPAELDTTFYEAGDWLVRTPKISELFFEERGSLAKSFEFLSQFAGAENRIFPGYDDFEVSIDERVMHEKETLRGALVHRKMRLLDGWRREGQQLLDQQLLAQSSATAPLLPGRTTLETAMLDEVSFAAVKLALKTKRLPLTEDDLVVKNQRLDLPLHDRFASGFSGIPLKDYYTNSLAGCGFPEEMLELTEFLIENRRAFKANAGQGPNDSRSVEKFIDRCDSEARLRALYVFTCADRFEWECEGKVPDLWFSIREMYGKLMAKFRPGLDPAVFLKSKGFDEEQITVLRSFGPSLLGGSYGEIGVRLGEALTQLALEPESAQPRTRLVRHQGSTILAVAARDFSGLAATISGALHHADVPVLRAHFFSSERYRVGLDFFHLNVTPENPPPDGLTTIITDAIERRLHLSDEAAVPREARNIKLVPWHSTSCRLSARAAAENAGGLIYALTFQVYHTLGANVHGLQVSARGDETKVSVYHNLPENFTHERAGEKIGKAFGNQAS
ncbi:MAG: hypothetical protein ACI8UO_001730 [Verrucomicrobiales bacterium]|jgi:hypothetical protein